MSYKNTAPAPISSTGSDPRDNNTENARDASTHEIIPLDPLSTSVGETPSAMRPLHWLFGLCAVPLASGAVVLRDAANETTPLPPSQDPWYTAPHGFEHKQPGDVLRIRPTPGNLTTVVGNTAAAYHVLYRTTDSRYKPSWAVTTLFIPFTFYKSPSGKGALLSYQLAYNTANLDSSPSIGLYWRLAQEDPNLGIKSSTSFIREMLAKGWIVNTPDFSGPTAAFGASVQAGHATIDAIRAIENLSNLTGANEINKVLWGYSGGSIATLAAAELQPRYAPELELAGTVLGGLVDNLSADLDNLNESPIAGTVISFLLGITAQYPDAAEYLESRLVEATKEKFLAVRDINNADTVGMFSGRDIYPFFKGGAADLQAPILRKLFNEQSKLGYKGVPNHPLFVYKAIGDQFCPVEQTDVTVKRFCEAGADVTYERNTVGEHVSEIENGKPRAYQFMLTIFDESHEAGESGCTINNVTVEVPVGTSRLS